MLLFFSQTNHEMSMEGWGMIQQILPQWLTILDEVTSPQLVKFAVSM